MTARQIAGSTLVSTWFASIWRSPAELRSPPRSRMARASAATVRSRSLRSPRIVVPKLASSPASRRTPIRASHMRSRANDESRTIEWRTSSARARASSGYSRVIAATSTSSPRASRSLNLSTPGPIVLLVIVRSPVHSSPEYGHAIRQKLLSLSSRAAECGSDRHDITVSAENGEILIVTEHQCSSVLVWQRGELGPNEHSGLGDLQRVGIGGGLGVVDARKTVLGFPLTFSPLPSPDATFRPLGNILRSFVELNLEERFPPG